MDSNDTNQVNIEVQKAQERFNIELNKLKEFIRLLKEGLPPQDGHSISSHLPSVN
jgi:hypothetical protein